MIGTMPSTPKPTRRTTGMVLASGLFALLTGCAGPSERPVPRPCTTELPGLSVYADENCRTCENVHFAAPGEPRRCGLAGKRPGGDGGDADGDGVADTRDACPETPAGVEVLANGCERVELEGVTFELDSARLRQGAREAMADQIDILRRSPDVRVEIAGHTDTQGASDYNRALSRRRARAVRDFIVESGIDGDRLTVKGYGENEPVASNDSPVGRERNRRVELRVLGR